ncbi:phosphodiester glycosidase family protein [Leptolyngbya sp. 7M]|uniref:phosphodiester glycosidase family protein n=1 Tax=Leptolyngbya sp. 7M TaxID=2812896 RepID=UPI001B8CD627|nr:phosphodiester glycosidase family protein [Leptolyngbya sp. 7M]QYO65681.1 phosphodiester glycosidase family protein [Leptolyngbya sp. 7M]
MKILSVARGKFLFAITDRSYLLLGLVCLLCVGSAAQEFRQVYPGIEHARVEHRIGEDPVAINVLRLDLRKVRLDVKLGMDQVVGTETTSSIAARHGALAAINAGFFRLDNSIFAGDPAGALMTDGVLLSESLNGRVAMMIENGRVETKVEFERADLGYSIIIKAREFKAGINRERQADDIVIYTKAFGNTSLTRPGGVEFIVQNGRIRRIITSDSSNPIPENAYLISASGMQGNELRRLARLNARVKIVVHHSSLDTMVPSSAFSRAEDITNGVSHLIQNGKVALTWEAEKASRSFAESRHPRTAVAKMKDGKLLMITVDGRQPGVSVGMTLQEVAEYLLSLGAVDAINLDGGGSTTMVLDGKVMNKPSDANGERKIGDAIIVSSRVRS